MDKVKALIEEASIHKIFYFFSRKPGGLKFNDTNVIVLTAKTDDGKTITRTFYFSMKANGTFDERNIARDGSRAKRQCLASFIKYYGIAGNMREYNIEERIGEWKGKTVEVVFDEKDGSIYIP